jgi:hypothetical protein
MATCIRGQQTNGVHRGARCEPRATGSITTRIAILILIRTAMEVRIHSALPIGMQVLSDSIVDTRVEFAEIFCGNLALYPRRQPR